MTTEQSSIFLVFFTAMAMPLNGLPKAPVYDRGPIEWSCTGYPVDAVGTERSAE